MRFLYPHLLWLLALLPLLAFIYGRTGKSPAVLFSSTGIAAALAAQKKTSPLRIKNTARLLVLGLLILASARPQLGNTTTEVQASGIDILLAVDVSGSMKAMDFTLGGKPANRLEVVKKAMETFIEERPNDRIGLVAFATKPYLVCPLTLDHDWLLKRLEALAVGIVNGDSTALGSAIGSGVNRLKDQQSKSRIMILLTDGLNNAGQIPPLAAAEAAKTMNVKIYTIGAGTRGEAPMPGTNVFGQQQMRMVRVDIDEETLTKVADLTGAQYFRATDTKSLRKIYDDINTMETTTRTIKKFEHYRELYPFFIGAALLFLTLELFARRRQLP